MLLFTLLKTSYQVVILLLRLWLYDLLSFIVAFLSDLPNPIIEGLKLKLIVLASSFTLQLLQRHFFVSFIGLFKLVL